MLLLPFRKRKTNGLGRKHEIEEEKTCHNSLSSLSKNEAFRSGLESDRRTKSAPQGKDSGTLIDALQPQKKKGVKKWIRRVFTKKSSTETEQGEKTLGKSSSKARSRSPTTCDTSITDESLSQDQRTEASSQHDIIVGLHSVKEPKPLLLAYSSEEEDGEEIVDIVDDSEDMYSDCTYSPTGRTTDETYNKDDNDGEIEIKFSLNDEADVEDSSDCDDSRDNFKPKFDRSEIISALFPKGHPDERRDMKPEVSPKTISAERIAALRRFIRDRKNAYNISSMVLRVQSELESVESPVQEPSTVGSSVTTTISVDEYAQKASHSRRSRKALPVADSSRIVGMLISWDPTWELLEPRQIPAATAKSRLKKLQDADDKDVFLLGEICDEASLSVESVGLSAKEEDLQDSSEVFVLGFHFDPERYPEESSDEDEIVFIDDTEDDSDEICDGGNCDFLFNESLATSGSNTSVSSRNTHCDGSGGLVVSWASNDAGFIHGAPDSQKVGNENPSSLPRGWLLPISASPPRYQCQSFQISLSSCSHYFDDEPRSSCDSLSFGSNSSCVLAALLGQSSS